MVEVVKHFKEKKFEIDCPNCDSTLRYRKKDIEVIMRKDINPFMPEASKDEPWETIQCPICRAGIFLRERDY